MLPIYWISTITWQCSAYCTDQNINIFFIFFVRFFEPSSTVPESKSTPSYTSTTPVSTVRVTPTTEITTPRVTAGAGAGKKRVLLRVGDWAKTQDTEKEENEKEKAKAVIGKMVTLEKNNNSLSPSPAGLKASSRWATFTYIKHVTYLAFILSVVFVGWKYTRVIKQNYSLYVLKHVEYCLNPSWSVCWRVGVDTSINTSHFGFHSNVSPVESGAKGTFGRVRLKAPDADVKPTAPAATAPSWIKDNKTSPRPVSTLPSDSKGEEDKLAYTTVTSCIDHLHSLVLLVVCRESCAWRIWFSVPFDMLC